MKSLPGNPGAERQAHLRAYLIAAIRDNFASKSELADIEALKRLGKVLIDDLAAGLASIGINLEAAQNLATEAVGGALAKRAVGWLVEKIGAGGHGSGR